MNASQGWEQSFDQFHPGAALIEQRSGLASALQGREWRVAGHDEGYVLLLAPER
jgi:hypothetical protein